MFKIRYKNFQPGYHVILQSMMRSLKNTEIRFKRFGCFSIHLKGFHRLSLSFWYFSEIITDIIAVEVILESWKRFNKSSRALMPWRHWIFFHKTKKKTPRFFRSVLFFWLLLWIICICTLFNFTRIPTKDEFVSAKPRFYSKLFLTNSFLSKVFTKKKWIIAVIKTL